MRPAGLTSRPIYTLHITCCIIHIDSYTLPLSHYILHFASCTLHLIHYILHIASNTLHRYIKPYFKKSLKTCKLNKLQIAQISKYTCCKVHMSKSACVAKGTCCKVHVLYTKLEKGGKKSKLTQWHCPILSCLLQLKSLITKSFFKTSLALALHPSHSYPQHNAN